MHSVQVLDHFQHPRNVGELPAPAASARVENPACGDIMTLSLLLEEGRVAAARYRTRGCVASIAAGSVLTEMVQGKTPAEARSITRQGLLDELGGLPPESTHATHLALDALAGVLDLLQKK